MKPKQMKTLLTRACPGTMILCLGYIGQIDTTYLTEGSCVLSYVVDSFMVVVVGGVGKLAGAITAGGALGFLTKYIEPFLEAVYGKLAVLGLIILFLQWRPSGLFPHRGRLAED